MKNKINVIAEAPKCFDGITAALVFCDEYRDFDFLSSLYPHLQQQCRKNMIALRLCYLCAGDFLIELECCDLADVDVYITPEPRVADKLLQNRKMVVMIRSYDLIDKCITINIDDYQAGKIAAEYLFHSGHSCVGTIFPYHGEDQRRNSFIDAFISLSGSCPSHFSWQVMANPLDSVAELMGKIKKSEGLPTAFYCYSDAVMFPAIRAFIECGFNIPEDISLLGTGNYPWGRIAVPAFSTVDIQEAFWVEKIIVAIKNTLAGKSPEHCLVPVRLISRETVRNLNIL